jgi:hypothetical protein
LGVNEVLQGSAIVRSDGRESGQSARKLPTVIWREVSYPIRYAAGKSPIISISGPLCSGKTTLAAALFPGHKYVSFDDPEVREFARASPSEFFKRCGLRVILDEFARVPEVVPVLKASVAADPRPGRVVLITSGKPQSPKCALPAEQTTAFTLLPPSIRELASVKVNMTHYEYIYRGFLPGAYKRGADPRAVLRKYCDDCVERYLSRFIGAGSHDLFARFLRLLATRIGQVISLNTLAEEVNVPQATLTSWIQLLEASYVIFRLPAYFNSFGRKVVRVPKLYFTDVGLAAHLCGVKDPYQVHRDPLVGNLFENMVVAEALKSRYNRGRNAGLYYFRNQNNLEIDLIISNTHNVIPVEIKVGAAFASEYTKNIKLFKKLSNRITNGYVIYSGQGKVRAGESWLVNFKNVGGIV